ARHIRVNNDNQSNDTRRSQSAETIAAHTNVHRWAILFFRSSFSGQPCWILMSALAEAAFHPCRQADAGFPKFIAQAICRGQCLVPALMKCRVQKLDLPRVPLKA